jgi:hypothetical protein
VGEAPAYRDRADENELSQPDMEYMHRKTSKSARPARLSLVALALSLAACGGGGSGGDGGSSAAPVTISGALQYEFVPPNANCQGLDFASTFVKPIRGATVQLVDDSNTELARTVSGDDGRYSFANVPPNSDVLIRVRAELKRTGSPDWDVEVRDNVVDPDAASPPALAERPLYAIVSEFNTGTADQTRNLTARTGWDGSSYSSTRAAAPFAVLDTIYSVMQLVLSVDPNASFAPLDAFWSVNNTSAGDSIDIDSGELTTSFYSGDLDSLFLLGDASVDTEEFDDHVIAHEWGHYFEDNFSRTDSVGGQHGIGDRLDSRLAFGEGWASALAGIALDDPVYCDTGRPGTAEGLLALGLEDGFYDAQGWYDEVSVLRLIYDLWDTTDNMFDDATGDELIGAEPDNGSIGFAPIYDVMVGPQAFTETFTNIFSFASELRATLPPEDQAFLDNQLLREDMTPGFDKWAVGELNDASPDGQQSRDVLPLYVDMPVDGTVVNICANDDYDGAGEGNKLATFRYLRMDIPSETRFDVRVVTTTTADLPPDDPDDPRDQSDPDLFIFLDGEVVSFGNSGEANEEVFTTATLAGPDTYVADLQEFRYADPESPVGFPDQMCFDVSLTPVP